MGWINLGDIDPKCGTVLMRAESAEFDGDFRADAAESVPETCVGGDDAVFLLRSGTVFLSGKNIPSALATVGARLEGDTIVRPGHHGDEERFPMTSAEGLREIFRAAHAFGGIDGIDISSLVRIGLPGRMDREPRFDGEITFYPEKTSLWAIMRRELDGFDLAPEKAPVEATPIDTDDGPYEGLPREIRTRADLAEMPAFGWHGTDVEGNPIVFRNRYEHRGCDVAAGRGDDAPSWTQDCSAPCPDRCHECGQSVEPRASEWIGPEEPALKALWTELEAVSRKPDHDAPDMAW
ncbi:hypothetical protein [Defluviimonas salinarum]|uniref:Uncharacterized protein n=1 Tax=Defluviimonas salinarum TaxID=2992147 RepID=A0ABT3J9D1_9RHOB|nr:hypothetical protein [Defluviimonas salinarum]MCW3784294.1 hypothetical protein [Defluviimonas salinarum]